MTELREFDLNEFERLRRVRECHEADRPSRREVTQALARFGHARPRRSRQRAMRIMWAAAATLLTLGAYAASNVLTFHSRSLESAPLSASSAAKNSRSQSLRRHPLRNEVRPPQSDSPLDLPPAAEALSQPEPASAVRPTVPRSQPAREASAPAPSQAASDDTARAWTQAADALRLGDHSTAQRALSELSRSDDAATRDAALLAQAELDLGTGDRARGRAILTGLAESGATPFVRKRARQIISELK